MCVSYCLVNRYLLAGARIRNDRNFCSLYDYMKSDIHSRALGSISPACRSRAIPELALAGESIGEAPDWYRSQNW